MRAGLFCPESQPLSTPFLVLRVMTLAVLQEEEEGIGDVDLFTLTDDRHRLVVNVKWLQHLQVIIPPFSASCTNHNIPILCMLGTFEQKLSQYDLLDATHQLYFC